MHLAKIKNQVQYITNLLFKVVSAEQVSTTTSEGTYISKVNDDI